LGGWQPGTHLLILDSGYTTYIHFPCGLLLSHSGQQFVWDTGKAFSNLAKHGVSFEVACQVFFDRFVRIEDASVGNERRDAAIGMTERWMLLLVVHIVREDHAIRIISARSATAWERRRYEDNE
jgi:uncharacterized protein